jgi:hypothetical protein
MMRALALRARAHTRTHWPSLVALSLMLVVVGAAVLTTAAGARRTRSAPDRFVRQTRSADLFIDLQRSDFAGAREIASTAGIANAGQIASMSMLPLHTQAYVPLFASVDGNVGTTFERGVLIAGRRARADASDEVALSVASARRLHAHVGSIVEYKSLRPATYACFTAQPPTCPDALAHPDGPRIALHVVGIVRLPNDLLATSQGIAYSVLPKGFFDRYHDELGFDALMQVRLARGVDVPTFVTRARKALPKGVEPTFEANEGMPVRDAAGVAATGLTLFAVVVGIAGLFVVAQAFARHLAFGDTDNEALRALGMSRVDRVLDRAVPLAPVVVLSTLGAVAAAYVASTTMPLGDAASAEPHGGRQFDAAVLAGGALLMLVVVGALGVGIALWRERAVAPHRARRRSWVATRAAVAGASPTAVAGLGMAFDGGQGRASTAARSAIVGCAAGMAGVIAVLGFSSGLSHLYGAPKLYGWGNIDAADIDTNVAFSVEHDPGVEGVAEVWLQMSFVVDGAPVYGMAMTTRQGHLEPSIASGRAPTSDSEVAIGRHTLSQLHRRVGESVHVVGTHGERTLRIVGVAVLPATDDSFPISDGILLTRATVDALGYSNDNGYHVLGVRFAPGADRRATLQRIARLQHHPATLPTAPNEVTKLRQVDRLPRVLAVLLALLAALATGHALFVAVRRRGHDLAVLRVLGFRPRQVASTVAWHGTAMVVAGALVGIPLGVVIGRVAWTLTAHTIGVLAVYRLPVKALMLIVPVSLVGAVLLSLLPARRAALPNPASILRSE